MKATYHKVKITGTLTLKSELHIGSGELGSTKERLKERIMKNPKEEIKGEFHKVVRNVNNLPYIPGSSLRGALLNKLGNDAAANSSDTPAWQNLDALKSLFGFTDSNESVNGKRGGSKVRFSGAHLNAEKSDIDIQKGQTGAVLPTSYESDSCTLLRPGVKIDRATGAAEDGKLFHHEVVAAGAVFDWEIAAENIDAQELALIAQLLATMDGSPINAIGGKKNNGQGCITWQRDQISVVDEALYQSWLQQVCNNQFVPMEWRKLESSPGTHPEFANWFTGTSSERKALSLQILSRSPLLINDPDIVDPVGNSEDKKAEGIPKKQYRRTFDGRPIIPGSSLKGVLRAQSEKIAATIAYQQALHNGSYSDIEIQKIIETAVLVGEKYASLIWGNEKQQGALRFSDLLAQTDDVKATLHSQSFNAIDRFTGGVKDGALYSVSAARCDVYQGECWIDMGLLQRTVNKGDNQGWQALLLFTLRDAMAGELHLGSGSAKGYGEFALAIGSDSGTTSTQFADLLAALQWQDHADTWLNELKQNLQNHLFKTCPSAMQKTGSLL